MDQDTLEGLRALLAILNRQNVNREVDHLFRPSASSTGPSVSTSVLFVQRPLQAVKACEILGQSLAQELFLREDRAEAVLDHTLTGRLQAINLPELLFFWRVRQRRTCHVGGSGKPYGMPDAKVESVFARG